MFKSKLVVLLLVFFLISSLLISCTTEKQSNVGNNEQGNDVADSGEVKNENQKNEENEEVDEFAEYRPIEGKEYVIEWLASHSNVPVPEDADMKLYWEEKYGVKFNLWYIERSRWDEILNVRLAGGEMPDIIHCESPDVLNNYYNMDLVMELPMNVLEEFCPKIVQNVNDVGEMEGMSPWVVTKIDGANYGIPKFNENGKYHFTPIWRKDWLENVGINKMPETLEEFEEAFYKFVNDDPDKNGKNDTYALSSGYKTMFAPIFGAFGFIPQYWSVRDGKIVYGAVQPEMKEALSYLSKWYKDGLINPEFITGENRGGHWSVSHDFISGIIGFTSSGPFYTVMPGSVLGDNGGKMYRAFAAEHDNPDDKILIGRPPIGPDGESGDVRWGIITGQSLAFSKELLNEKDKFGKILEIVEDMNTDYDNYIKLFYGIEGEHHQINDKGQYEFIIPEGVSPEEYGIGMVFNAYTGVFNFGDKQHPAYYQFANEVATYSNNYTDILYTTLPSKQIYWDELDKLQKETYINIITGAEPIDYFDSFVEQWFERGGAELVEEANAWYDSVK